MSYFDRYTRGDNFQAACTGSVPHQLPVFSGFQHLCQSRQGVYFINIHLLYFFPYNITSIHWKNILLNFKVFHYFIEQRPELESKDQFYDGLHVCMHILNAFHSVVLNGFFTFSPNWSWKSFNWLHVLHPQENAHFSISEALIAAIEQMKWNHVISPKDREDPEEEDSDEEINKLKQRIRIRKQQKLREVSPNPKCIHIHYYV